MSRRLVVARSQPRRRRPAAPARPRSRGPRPGAVAPCSRRTASPRPILLTHDDVELGAPPAVAVTELGVLIAVVVLRPPLGQTLADGRREDMTAPGHVVPDRQREAE